MRSRDLLLTAAWLSLLPGAGADMGTPVVGPMKDCEVICHCRWQTLVPGVLQLRVEVLKDSYVWRSQSSLRSEMKLPCQDVFL
eukprot:Skav220575  [mRNA]  locus=scaffold145:162069:164802:- [translate_table: standard]